MDRIAIGRAMIRQEVDALLQHSAFRKSPKLSNFLSYIVRETLEGRGHLLKAYTIATDALDRPPSFDPISDSIVRVEARRLRQILTSIYADPACGRLVRVELPVGRYEPVFRTFQPESTAGAAAPAPVEPSLASALSESEQRYKALVAASAVIEWRADPSGMVTHSHGWTERTGQDEDAHLGRGWLDVLHPDDRPRAQQAWQAVCDGGGLMEVAYRVRHLDGSYRPMLARAVPVENRDGTIREWVGTVVDAPGAARKAEERGGADGTPQAVSLLDVLRQAQGASARAEKFREAAHLRLEAAARRCGLRFAAAGANEASPGTPPAKVRETL